MKTNKFKSLWSAALGLVLFAAVPFAASAQTASSSAPGKIDSAKQTEDRFTVTLTGKINGKGKIRFYSNMLDFFPDADGEDRARQYPIEMTVNGKPWAHPEWSFLLDFVADYSDGTIVRQSDGVTAGWKLLAHDNSVSISDRRERTIGELSIAGNGEPFQIELSFAKYPLEYADRINAMRKKTREKNNIAELDKLYRSNSGQLIPANRKLVEQYREERRQERIRWMRDPDYTTDGKELPPVESTAAVSSRRTFPDQFEITIEATVNVVAKFAFQGSRIVYRDSSRPNDGNYPSQVKINGKPWKNLHMPFMLDNAIDHDSVLGTQIETEYYSYTLQPEREWIALTVTNYGPRDEETVKIKLTVLKSKKPVDNSVIYSGGVALPAEVMTDPDAFENFWKNAMRPRSGNSPETQSESK
jgi:hypothetical protein